MSSGVTSERSRIAQLERQLRRLRLIVIAGVVGSTGMGLSGFGRPAPEVVRAQRVELVSPAGIRQAVLGTDTLGFAVTVLDQRGRPVSSLRLSTEPRVSVETGDGREVAGLGAPRPRNLTE